jgi:hypothetical protein
MDYTEQLPCRAKLNEDLPAAGKPQPSFYFHFEHKTEGSSTPVGAPQHLKV